VTGRERAKRQTGGSLLLIIDIDKHTPGGSKMEGGVPPTRYDELRRKKSQGEMTKGKIT